MNVDRAICRNYTAVRLENNSDQHMYYKIMNKTISLHYFLDTEGYLPPYSMVLLYIVINGQNKQSTVENYEMVYTLSPEETDVQQAFRLNQREIRKIVFSYSNMLLSDTDERAMKLQDSSTNERSRVRYEEQAESSQSHSNVVRLSRKRQPQSRTFNASLSESVNVSLPVLPHYNSAQLEATLPLSPVANTTYPLGESLGQSAARAFTAADLRSSDTNYSLAQEERSNLYNQQTLGASNTKTAESCVKSNDIEAIRSVVRVEPITAENDTKLGSLTFPAENELQAQTTAKNAFGQQNRKLYDSEYPGDKLVNFKLSVDRGKDAEKASLRTEMRDMLKLLEERIINLEKEALSVQALDKQLAKASVQLDELMWSVHNSVKMIKYGRVEQVLTCATLIVVVLLYRLLRL